MNCKPTKDTGCESCDSKRLCRTYLGLKPLDEYDDTEPIGYSKRVKWDNDLPIIATITRNPILGIVIETNVTWSSIPERKKVLIRNWAYREGERKLR
ncbi:unnamed protein product, partial [marine sediment metagenome]